MELTCEKQIINGFIIYLFALSTVTLNSCGRSNIKARVLAFGYTEGGDLAHADFAKEANDYFKQNEDRLGIKFEFAGTDWTKLTYNNLKKYKMTYVNWGHNLMDYNDGEEGTESNTFDSPGICEFIANTIKAYSR